MDRHGMEPDREATSSHKVEEWLRSEPRQCETTEPASTTLNTGTGEANNDDAANISMNERAILSGHPYHQYCRPDLQITDRTKLRSRNSFTQDQLNAQACQALQRSRSAPQLYSATSDRYGSCDPQFGSDGHVSRRSRAGVDNSQQPVPEGFDIESVLTDETFDDDQLQELIQEELESKWILNLSMRLRDKADREKFFVTYAERPNKWRRITVTVEYRHAVMGSLEADLKDMTYQRDKSARIYESIRESLLDIQFYKTVTNLKLKTTDGLLHVHCSEDKNEIILYPRALTLSYLSFPVYRESEVLFRSHISGFVYTVLVDDRILVKKEIPGPSSVEEFLYEVTALSSMQGAEQVIQLRGLVVDDAEHSVKGLLIDHASSGALIDLLYTDRVAAALPWSRRAKWAQQIIQGISEVHEAGFVQGDLTLSNIVIDEQDDAKLIDINRRGCPMGWEPPELEVLIRAGQHISMFIGVKTDLFQLGMVLWALAMCVDEPELEARPLSPVTKADVPSYFRIIIDHCLQTDPRRRVSAKELLALFPNGADVVANSVLQTIIPLAFTGHGSTHKIYNHDLLLAVPSVKQEYDPSVPSQPSEVSSIRTTGPDTIASSDCMSEARRGVSQDRNRRDWSPLSR